MHREQTRAGCEDRSLQLLRKRRVAPEGDEKANPERAHRWCVVFHVPSGSGLVEPFEGLPEFFVLCRRLDDDYHLGADHAPIVIRERQLIKAGRHRRSRLPLSDWRLPVESTGYGRGLSAILTRPENKPGRVGARLDWSEGWPQINDSILLNFKDRLTGTRCAPAGSNHEFLDLRR